MNIADINPFLRYAELQISVLSSAPHSSAYDYRIFYIISGKTHLVLSDGRMALGEGDLVFLRPATPYYFEEKVQTIVLNFDLTRNHTGIREPLAPSRSDFFNPERVTENDPPEPLCAPIRIERAFALEPMLRECIFHYSFPSELSDAITSAALKRIICTVAERLHRIKDGAAESGEMLAKNVLLYLKNNYFDPSLSAEVIAAEFGYHPYYLNKVFKDHIGTTIHKALIGERMEMAKKLLATTKLSVNDIAFEIGFSDRSRFCTAFRHRFGITPLAYRKSYPGIEYKPFGQ